MGFEYVTGKIPLSALVCAKEVPWPKDVGKTAAKKIFNGKKPDFVDPALFEHERTQMERALSAGWGKGFKVEFGKPDWDYIQHLRYNTAVFSAFKCNHQIKDVHRLLTDDSGTPRTWKEFYTAAERISDQYNRRWLQTEFNTAHASAKAAKKWHEFVKDADLYPSLQYITSGDKRVRASHRRLNGVIRPINDPFWSAYYPPNDWGCRCGVRQTDKPETALPDDIDDVTNIFAHNPGKDAQVFDESHPYYEGLTEKEKANALLFVQQFIRDTEDVRARHQEMISRSDWDKPYFNGDNGGYTAISPLHKRDPKTFRYELEALNYFAKRGGVVLLIPEPYGPKQHDASVDGIKTEAKVAFGPRNMLTRAQKAVEQGATRLVFNIKFDNRQVMFKRLRTIHEYCPELTEIFYVYNGVMYEYKTK